MTVFHGESLQFRTTNIDFTCWGYLDESALLVFGRGAQNIPEQLLNVQAIQFRAKVYFGWLAELPN